LYFYHTDHLGSSSLVTTDGGYVTQHVEYVPFGEVFIEERDNETWSTPYKFNGKELDEETGLYYYGERYYDPRASLWLGVDPLAEKYPNVGGYVYCMQNPVLYIDPNGMENVVTVGNQGNSPNSDTQYKDKRHFLERGLNDAIDLKKNHTEKGEQTTMIVYKGQYTNSEMNSYKERAGKNGINFIEANSADDIVNYINTKSVSGTSDTRSNDVITDFEYVGHGHPQEGFLVGYHMNDEKFKSEKFQASAFDPKANFKLFGCGQGLTSAKMSSYYSNKKMGSTLMDDVSTRLTSGTIIGYNVTLIWGPKLGTFSPFNLSYAYPDDRNGATIRFNVPVEERRVVLQGNRK